MDLARGLTPGTAWLLLLLAAGLEVCWALALRQTDGFTRFWPSVVVVVAGVCSVALLGLAARLIPIGTAYAVWTGIGAACTALFGMLLFDEPRTAGRVVCIALIVSGVVGLRLLAPR